SLRPPRNLAADAPPLARAGLAPQRPRRPGADPERRYGWGDGAVSVGAAIRRQSVFDQERGAGLPDPRPGHPGHPAEGADLVFPVGAVAETRTADDPWLAGADVPPPDAHRPRARGAGGAGTA